MKKQLVASLIIGLLLFVGFASHLNLRGREDGGPNFFTDGTYNFVYKLGYPTPWYSRYYNVPEKQLSDYEGKDRLPDYYVIYTDRSYSILAVQFGLALMGSGIFFVLIRLISWVCRRPGSHK